MRAREKWWAFGTGPILLYYRRLVQDKQPIHWRDEVNAVPDAREQALIDAEMKVAT